jgi:hypothetical protein
MANLDFYEGRRSICVKGRMMTVEDLHERMGFDALEESHSFIQWIFPSDEASRFNHDSVVLSAADASAIAGRIVPALRVKESLTMMLEFYGFEHYSDGVRVRDRQRLQHLVRNTHNWMRISRILRSLVLLGLSCYAKAFLCALEDAVAQGDLAPCQSSCDNFWRKSAHGPIPGGFPNKSCLTTLQKLECPLQIKYLCEIVRRVRCLGARRLLRAVNNTDQPLLVGVETPKKICILVPKRMHVIILAGLRKKSIPLRLIASICILGDDSSHIHLWKTDDSFVGFRVYKLARSSYAYGGTEPMCAVRAVTS